MIQNLGCKFGLDPEKNSYFISFITTTSFYLRGNWYCGMDC